MEPEMVSTTVDDAPAFLQLRDKYKQELVEDTRLTKAADLAAKQHVLLCSCLETASTQSRGTSITPLDQKCPPTVWGPS